MPGNLTTADVQLIANLINDKYSDLADHVSKEIRMVKLTVQENHAVSVEGRDFGRKTNGRVSKIEDDLYGETDKYGRVQSGKEGLLYDFCKVKQWSWYYQSWKVPAVIGIMMCALFIKESRDYVIDFIKIIKIF